MLTKAELRQKIIDLFDSDENLYGWDGDFALAEFVKREKICPEAVEEVLAELGDEGYRLKGGRMCIRVPRHEVGLGEQFSNEVWAHKHLHTGGIRCPSR